MTILAVLLRALRRLIAARPAGTCPYASPGCQGWRDTRGRMCERCHYDSFP